MGCGTRRGGENGKRETELQVVEGFLLKQAQAGARLWQISSPKVLLREDLREAQLQEPRMEFFQKKTRSAVLNARAGKLDTRTQDVYFSTQVVLLSFQQGLTLKANSLQYKASSGKIYSHEKVLLEKRGSMTEAEGLEAKPDLSEITFKKQQTRFLSEK